MDALIKSAGRVMQLMLLPCLLLLLPLLFDTGSDPLADGVVVADWAARTFSTDRPRYDSVATEQMRLYGIGVWSEDTPTSVQERRVQVGAVRVEELLKVERFLVGVGRINLREGFQNEDWAHLVLDEHMDGVEQALTRVKGGYFEMGSPADATLNDLAQAERAQIELPIVGRLSYVTDAVPVVGVTLVWVLLYLVSLHRTIRRKAASNAGTLDEGADWLFLHEGRLGPALGLLWLLFPVTVLVLAVGRGVLAARMGLTMAVVLAALALWGFAEAMEARYALEPSKRPNRWPPRPSSRPPG